MSVDPMTSQITRRRAIPLYYAEWSAEPEGRARTLTARQILAMMRRRRLLIVLATACGLVGGILYGLWSEPRYVAMSQLIIDPRSQRVVENEVTPAVDNAEAQVAIVENEMRVLKSSAILDALITRDHLEKDPEFAGDPPGLLRRIRSAVVSVFDRTPARVTDPRIAVAQALDRKIAVRRTERSFVVDVTVTTRDPVKSAKIANDLVAIYAEAAVKVRSDLAKHAGSALDDRLAELRTAMRASEDRVETFKAKHDLVSANGLLTRDQRLRDLNTQLAAARVRANEMQSRMEQAAGLRGNLEAMPEAVQSPAIIQLRGQIAEARRRQANLANNLGPRHPDLLAIGKEVGDLQALVEQELRRIGDAARNDYKRAKQTEDGLQNAVDALSRTSFVDSRALGELRELEREADARRTLFAQYLVRSRELTEQTRVDLSNVRAIGTAVPPDAPSNLPKGVSLVLGTLIGLGIGAVAAILLGVLRGEASQRAERDDEADLAPARAIAQTARPVEHRPYFGAIRSFE